MVKGGFESRLNGDIQFILYIPLLRKEGDKEVTIIVEFIVGIIGRIVSSVSATYLVRLLDKFTHKNNRHEK